MRFDQGLRSAMMKPYPLGYEAPSTEDVNREEPRCQFGGMRDGGVWVGEEGLPSLIELQVRLTPIWIEDEAAVAALDDNTPCRLYPSQAIFSRVLMDYEGAGRYQKTSGGEMLPFAGYRFLDYGLEWTPPHLYHKEFLTQPMGRHIHWFSHEEGGELTLPLWAYGGQSLGGDVHPLVFTLEFRREETHVSPSSLAYWRERGILPPQGGWTGRARAVFQDKFVEDQTRSLIESVEAGMSVIFLILGVDEGGEVVRVPYKSYRLSHNQVFYKRGA